MGTIDDHDPDRGAPDDQRGEALASVSRITPEASWKSALRSARAHLGQDRVSMAAGSFAYRWFLSLFPVIVALLAVSAALHIPHRTTVQLIDGITKALPSGAAEVFTSAISHSTGSHRGEVTTVVLAAAVGLWSATSGMVMVEEGLDMAYEIDRDRSFLAKRILALPLLLAAVVLGGSASALVVFGHAVETAVRHAVPFAGSEFVLAWSVAHWIVALVLIGLLFSVLYYLAPNRREPLWQWISPGAVVGTALWALISVGFSYYTQLSGSYTTTYGAFAGVAILIFWLYLTGVAILAGGAGPRQSSRLMS